MGPPEVLRTVLPSGMFSQLMQRRQMQEINEAGLEDLVQCPACSFATVMPDPLFTVLRCGNPACGRGTCRLCKEDSHVPLACEEVEKNAEVKLRTKLEDAMTDAMVRECVSCKKRFFKEEGCNKMKCDCGQSMCYLCRKPVSDDYKHFYGEGGSPVAGKCPLWSENDKLHNYEVAKAVEEAKKKMDLEKLKFDPTKNLVKPPKNFDPNRIAVPRDVDMSDTDSDDDENDLGDFIEDDDDGDSDEYNEGWVEMIDW